MSKMKDAMRLDIVSRFGEDAGKALDYLFDYGTIDDQMARNHNICVEMFKRLQTTRTSRRQLEHDIAEDFGLSRGRVFALVTNAGQ